MRATPVLRHEFVDHIPTVLAEGTGYVAVAYATAVHRCCCGCGHEVVTPLSPTDWTLLYDGETISLDPSIGNWSFVCKSHYWVRRGKVRWAERWSDDEIAAGRARDRSAKVWYFDRRASPNVAEAAAGTSGRTRYALGARWRRLKRWWLDRSG